jgi:polyphosphate glucokinase
MTKSTSVRASKSRRGLRTLAIDVGGTGIKASVLDSMGRMVVDRVRMATPHPCPPVVLLQATVELTKSLPAFDRISIGFPGVVRQGRVITAPNFGTEWWHDFPLQDAVSQQFNVPARLLNDAEVQGLGVIKSRGLEVVLTLGTGVGSAVFVDGRLAPHLELAHHPLHKSKTYNEYLGNDALASCGVRKWSRRVHKMIGIVHTLLNYDVLYIGGGNAQKVEGELPDNVHMSSNDAGLTGGIHLWEDSVWSINGDAGHRRAE